MGASDLAAALGLRRVGHNRYRGACVLCGRRTLEVRDGDHVLLATCWHGCDRRDVLAELRRRGLLPSREWTPQEREAWRREQERRREAERFSSVARLLGEQALEALPFHHPDRRDLTELLERLRLDPGAELDWFRKHHPALTAAMVAAARTHEGRLRQRAEQWVSALAAEVRHAA
jgi:hypothetical protein